MKLILTSCASLCLIMPLNVRAQTGCEDVAPTADEFRVVTVAGGEGRETGAIELHSVVVDQIGVLCRLSATRGEVDLSGLLIDVLDATDHPFSPGDLVLHLACQLQDIQYL